MERKVTQDGKEVLFLDKFQLIYLCSNRISDINLRFAIRGEYPLDAEGRDAYKLNLAEDVAAYYLAQDPRFAIDPNELAATTRVVFGGTFPEHKQAELEDTYASANRVFIDADDPQRATLLDWFHGAVFIPTYE